MKTTDATYTVHGSSEARAILREHRPIDLHADTLMWDRFGYDMLQRHAPPLPGARIMGHVDLPRMLDVPMGAQFFGIVTVPVPTRANRPSVIRQISSLHRSATQSGGRLAIATDMLDAIAATRKNAVAAYVGVEGAHALDHDATNVEAYARIGMRYLGLGHFTANDCCRPSGGFGTDESRGLTSFGYSVIHECIRHGVVVDVAHCNRRGFIEACSTLRQNWQPAIVSHTGVRGVHDHWRNIDDLQLRAVADTGGVVGIIFAGVFLGGDDPDAVVRHMTHVAETVGDDHVALGSDYDGFVKPVRGLTEIGMLPNLVDAMLRAKWKPARIEKALRTNVLRVLRDAPAKWDVTRLA